MKRIFSLATAFCLTMTAGVAATASAQEYPNRPIELVVPFAAGGMGTNLGRVIGEGLGEQLGQTVYVNAKPGAGGIVGFQYVRTAKPDGHTLLLGTISTLSLAPSLYKELPFNPETDFEPIAMTFTGSNIVVVNANSDIHSLKELADKARKNPGKLTFGSSGNATTVHLLGGLFNELNGTDMLHVPYKGLSPALVALMAGEVDVVFSSTEALTHIESGRLRPLAVTSKSRLPFAPDIPTVEEQGMPELLMESWYGILAPKGTPQPVLDQVNAALKTALEAERIQELVRTVRMSVAPDLSRDYFAQQIRSERERWAPVVKAAGISVD